MSQISVQAEEDTLPAQTCAANQPPLSVEDERRIAARGLPEHPPIAPGAASALLSGDSRVCSVIYSPVYSTAEGTTLPPLVATIQKSTLTLPDEMATARRGTVFA